MPRKQSEEDILETARKRFKLAEDAEQEIRKEALDDLRFCAGEQWAEADRNTRKMAANSRPCLTINKLIGPLNQTANEARLNQAGIEVHPVDSRSDPDTADVIEGMIRHIEYVSKAEEVYETALEQSTSCGFGYFRVITRYCGPKSFNQELRIERVVDPFSVFLDPFAKEADKSDMKWAFEVEIMPQDEYKEQYPDSKVSSFDFYHEYMNPAPDWIKDNAVRVARYWTVETVPRKLRQIAWSDGTQVGVFKDDIGEEPAKGQKFVEDREGSPIERDTEEKVVRWRKINGAEILEEGEWPGQWIPILPVLGKEMWVNGRRQIFSLVRFAKDPQQIYNFARSCEAETMLLGSKAPWIGVKGSFRDPRWASANTIPYATLEYEPLDIAGNPAPPPMRNTFEPPIQAFSLAAAQAADDIKATTGIFDASLGAQGNETSGIAIRQRQSQAGLSNAHFIDNLNRAIRQCGVILCDLIPRIYDMPREVRILGEDRAQQIVKVNQIFADWMGQNRCYDLRSGQYDVTITVGPSYTTQRQESWDILTQLAQANPQLLQVAGDILFRNADFPGAQEVAERMAKMLPPALQDQPGNPQQQAQALAAQLQQQGQMITQLTQALQNEQERNRTRMVEKQSDMAIKQMEIESSDRQAALKAQVDLITNEAKLSSNEAIALLRAQIAAAEAQIRRMSSGAAAQISAAPAPPTAPMPPGATPPQVM